MQLRNKAGQFAKRGSKAIVYILIAAGVFVAFDYGFDKWYRDTISYTAEALVIEKIVEVKTDVTIEEMKRDLIDVVWKEESGQHVPNEGELLLTFDPSSKDYEKCIRIGGFHPKDCMSYGPMQIKIGTIQRYAPEVYGKEVSEKEARDIAENLGTAQHFFLECSIKVKGCVWNWTGAQKHRGEVELLIKYIRGE